jgi:hypothetical protein
MAEVSDEVFWTDKIKKHWKPFTICIIVGIILFISFFLVLVNYVNMSAIGGFGTWTFDQFSIGTVLLFLVYLLLWDLLLVVLPGGVFFVLFVYLWWKKLPEAEQAELKSREEKSKSRKTKTKQYGGGGGASFVINIIFLIIVGIYGGQLFTPFGSLPYSYFINAYLAAMLWFFIIFIIPACVAGLIWFVTKK